MSINVNVGNIIPTNVVEVGNEISADQLAAITAANSPSAINPFSTASHIHTIANVSGLQTSLNGKSDVEHLHLITNITGLQSALDGKSGTGHSHEISGVTGLLDALDGKANIVHSHVISDVTGLQTALDGKSATTHLHTGVYAPVTHSHTIADVTGLQTILDGLAEGVDISGKLDLTGGTMTGGLVFALNDTDARITFNDGSIQSTASYSKAQSDANLATISTWLATKSDVGHTHAIADVTSLQTSLDSKLALPVSWVEGVDIARTFNIVDGVLTWDGTYTIDCLVSGAFAFNNKITCTETSTNAGLNLTPQATPPTSTVAGDVWIGTNFNYKSLDGSTKSVANTNTANTFTSFQVVNVTTPNTALRVTQKGTGYALVVEDSVNPDPTPFIVNTSGQVIVGRTTAANPSVSLTLENGLYANAGSNVANSLIGELHLAGIQGDATSDTNTYNYELTVVINGNICKIPFRVA